MALPPEGLLLQRPGRLRGSRLAAALPALAVRQLLERLLGRQVPTALHPLEWALQQGRLRF